MHIPYEPQNIGFIDSASQRGSLKNKLWQFIRFTVVTGVLFVGAFLIINFSAYKVIFLSMVRPEAQAQAESVLQNSTGEKPVMTKNLLLTPDKKEIRKSFVWIDMPIAPTDNRLVIPKLGKSIPLVNVGAEHLEGENWADLEKQIQDGLRQGVVHYPGTARPGQYGNVFITGHSSYYPWDPGQFKDVFALLGQLEPGERFYVYFDQIKYTYNIIQKFEVQPTNVSVLEQPKDKKIATLMTCTPVGTTLRRLIIQAEQI